MLPLLSEPDCRRADFQADSVPVVLADGQAWYLPRPYVECFGRFEGGKLVTVASETQFGPEFDRLTESLVGEDGSVRYADYFALAALLLTANYDLADADLPRLLRHRRDDAASIERMQAVIDVALGNAPKAPAAGDGSPA